MQPIWKICSSKWIISPIFRVKIKITRTWNQRSTWIIAVGVDDSLPFGAPANFSGAFAVVSFREDIWVASHHDWVFRGQVIPTVCSKSSAPLGSPGLTAWKPTARGSKAQGRQPCWHGLEIYVGLETNVDGFLTARTTRFCNKQPSMENGIFTYMNGWFQW